MPETTQSIKTTLKKINSEIGLNLTTSNQFKLRILIESLVDDVIGVDEMCHQPSSKIRNALREEQRKRAGLN